MEPPFLGTNLLSPRTPQELGAALSGTRAGSALVAAACGRPQLRGSRAHVLALELLAEEVATGRRVAPAALDAALSEAVLAGEAGRPAALQLAAEILAKHGLSFGIQAQKGKPCFKRLGPLLELAAAELRLCLEGWSPQANLCAACMALEAAIIAFGREAEELEQGGELEQVAETFGHFHRAIGHILQFVRDLPADGHAVENRHSDPMLGG